MAAAALIGFAALLLLAFGVRTAVHARRTATTGWVVPPTAAARVGDGLFMVGALGALGTLLSPALVLADLLEPSYDALTTEIVGTVLLTVGATIALVAQAQMGTVWRAGIDLSRDDPLLTHGLFRTVRNPFYLGVILASAGVTLMVPTGVALASWAALVIGCSIDVRLVEEPHLRAAHGADYERYAAATPRFVPSIRDGP
jgi:protein-S-isoprenylcysteine O-methyltransferase Ste14